jgi:predicted alpha/beta hydrolase
VTFRETALTAADGFTLSAEVHEAPEPRAAVLLAPATGVSRRIYRPLAGYLAGRGFSVLLVDYRGTGDSRPASLRGFVASAEDWARLDLAAAFDAAAALAPGHPVSWLGHSIGGQLLGLCPRRDRVRSALLVGHEIHPLASYASCMAAWGPMMLLSWGFYRIVEVPSIDMGKRFVQRSTAH